MKYDCRMRMPFMVAYTMQASKGRDLETVHRKAVGSGLRSQLTVADRASSHGDCFHLTTDFVRA